MSGRRGGGGGRRFPRRQVNPIGEAGIIHVDYKDVALLRQFISDLGKIEPRRRRGISAKHQRSLAQAIKRARHLGLLPFVDDGRAAQRERRSRGGRGGRGGGGGGGRRR